MNGSLLSLALELLKLPQKLQLQHNLEAAKPNHTFLIKLPDLNFTLESPESISSLIVNVQTSYF